MKKRFSIKSFKKVWRHDTTKHYEKNKLVLSKSYSSSENNINYNELEKLYNIEVNPSGTYSIPNIIESTSESSFEPMRKLSLDSIKFSQNAVSMAGSIDENEISLSDNSVGDNEEDRNINIKNCSQESNEHDHEINIDHFNNVLDQVSC